MVLKCVFDVYLPNKKDIAACMKDHDEKRERIQATKLILELWILVVHLRPFFMILDLNPESPSVGSLIPHETAGS